MVCEAEWRLGTPGLRSARFSPRVSPWVVYCVGRRKRRTSERKSGPIAARFTVDWRRGYWAALMLIVSFWAMGSPPWMKVSDWSPVGALDGTSTLN